MFRIQVVSVLFVSFLLLFTQFASAVPTTKVEHQINIVDQTYSTTSTSDVPTNNSLGLIKWETSPYTSPTVYFEALIYCDTCSGGNASAKVTLYDSAGSPVSGVSVSTTNPDWTLMRTADITSSLTNSTKYTVQLKVDASSGTAWLKAARLIIVQSNSTALTDSRNYIEIGNKTAATSTSYSLMTAPKTFSYQSTLFPAVSAAYFEATLQSDNAAGTAYAALSSDNCSSTVTGSEVSITGTSWDLYRSSDISGNLSADTDYVVCLKSTTGDTASISNAHIIIDQYDVDGISTIPTYYQYANTNTTIADSTYASQSFNNQFTPGNIVADRIKAYFEVDLQSGGQTAYAQLFNTTGSAMSGSERSTAASSYTRLITADIFSNLPTSTATLDVQIRNQSTYTTSLSNAWLILAASITPDAAITFSVEGVSANEVTNAITTSEASDYNTLDFGHLYPSTPKYMAHQLYVSTNAYYGYQVSLKMLEYLQGNYPANNIDPFTSSWSSPATWSSPDGTTRNDNTGWIGANTSDTRVSGWSDAAAKFGPVNSSENTVMYSSSEDSGTYAYITYAIEVNILQPSDLYSGSIIYNVLPIY